MVEMCSVEERSLGDIDLHHIKSSVKNTGSSVWEVSKKQKARSQ